MKRLGPLVRLQIQTASLKRGEKPHQWYDPSALLEVEALSLDAKGVALADGSGALDVHHLDHPQSKQVPGENAISMGFTAHYGRMRARFGAPARDGVAGENLIVECPDPLGLEALEGGLVIRSQATGAELRVHSASVAHPCRPFSLFMLGREAAPEALKETLQFLDGGTRGFYLATDAEEPFLARLGDEVFAL